LANHELVIFDQRGTGYSEPSLACPESEELMLSTLDEDLDSEQSKGLLLQMVTACHDRLRGEGIDLAAYNSRENAADVDDLRRALGYDQWDLYGISYGTRLAQTVMRDFPDGVRSVVLDSTYPLSADLTVDTIANMDRAFDTFFAGCAANAACSEAYPDLENRFFALADTLNATPILVPVLHVFTGQQLEALVDGDTM
ncbi:MAG: alpha/beta fold hydrolase, partial [Anaerolineae bacterium]|nr:alpha/beta fold hydrolase [Anaerolineae bacterium]